MNSARLRIGRHSIVGQSYIFTTVCRHRRRSFEHRDAALIVIDAMRDIERRQLTCSYAWVVMPDHVHWLFALQTRALSDVARQFKSSCSLAFNRGCGGTGSLWQSGYHDHAIRSNESLHRHAIYIVANPVRAGLAGRLGEYPYAWCRWPMQEW